MYCCCPFCEVELRKFLPMGLLKKRLPLVQTLKSLLQHHSSKASILWRSAFFTVQLSHPYMTTGKTIALTAAAAAAAAAAKSLQSCLTLCHPIDGSPPGPAIPGILQARTMEWVAISFSNLLQYMKVKSESEVAQSCPTLSDPMDCSLPDSSLHGIFQATVLEWGAIAFSHSLD